MKHRKEKAHARFDYRGFARRLRIVRVALGLTEEQAAAAAGRTVETWRHYEKTGLGHLTGPLIMFSAKYDLSLDWLYTGDGPPPRPRAKLRVICSDIVAERSPRIGILRLVRAPGVQS